MKRKAVAIVCSSAMAVGGMFLFTGNNSSSKAAVPAPFTPSQHFAGYATGTDVFVDAAKSLSPGVELANVNVGYAASAANSSGLLGGYVPALPVQAASPGVNAHPAIKAFAGTPSTNGVTPGTGLVNEMAHSVVPPSEATFGNTLTDPFQSYGRGSGLEVGLGTSVPNNPDLNQVILAGMAEQMATPKTPGGNTFPDNSLTREIGPVPGDPLIFASLLKGQAAGNWDAGHCPGDPAGTFPVNPAPGGFDTTGGQALNDTTKALGWGQGTAAQAELINTGMGPLAPKLGDPNDQPLVSTTGGSPANRVVSTAKSFTHLVPNGDGSYALVSETHETIAPVTLFKGTANQITIEVLGEAVMKAIVTGSAATTKVVYSPPPLVRITPPGGPPNDIPIPFGGQAPAIQVSVPGMPGTPNLLDLFIGEPPRAPDQAVPGNSDSGSPVKPIIQPDGTLAWAAVDVVRVKLLVPDPVSHLAEVREGHMEVQAAVPSGGVTCTTPAAATTTAPGGGSTTTTGAGGGTTTTAPGGGTTTTTAATTPGGASTTTTAPGGGNGTTTTTAAGGNNNGNGTTTTTGLGGTPGAGTSPPTTAQVQAVTFSQTPTASAQTQTPNFTG
ncbi:MAG TPA: hypothetical protein VG076_13155 [Acidimicrobiales bacterium]|jgi:hypothetical protein|nr:hypothetical protein [Acidimicrobiales bacterium]